MKNKQLIASSLLLIALSLLFLLPSCSNTHAESASGITNEQKIPNLLPRHASLGSTDERVKVSGAYDQCVAALKADPKDAKSSLRLARLFMNEARITGEHPYYYPAAMNLIDDVLAMDSKNPDIAFPAMYMKASVQLSLHDFQNALETGKTALVSFPRNAGVYGILVDANLELGNYEEAVKMSDKMVSIRPDLRSYSRISYLREIHGEVDGAIEAMKLAVAAGLPGTESTSWCRLTLGNLYESYGDLSNAKMHYSILLQERPNYPFAMAALAGIEIKNKNYELAESQLNSACEIIPEVGFYQQKVELFQALGRNAEAEKLIPVILEMMQEDADAGHNMDLELAKVWLNYKNNPRKALEYAQKEYQIRPNNIEVNKVLAEIYYVSGDFNLAKQHIAKARVTNSQNPELLHLAGQIMVETGEDKAGRKLILTAQELNPFMGNSVSGDIQSNE